MRPSNEEDRARLPHGEVFVEDFPIQQSDTDIALQQVKSSHIKRAQEMMRLKPPQERHAADKPTPRPLGTPSDVVRRLDLIVPEAGINVGVDFGQPGARAGSHQDREPA